MSENTRRASAAFQRSLIVFLICSMNLTASAASPEDLPAVGFSCDFPGSDPAHYAIRVSSDGHGNYSSNGKLSRDSDSDETFSQEFSLPQSTAARIFDLAQKAHYFEGNIDTKRKNIASTGEKTLTYVDAKKNTSATYNYSVVPAVQELTTIFQSLSTVLESGRRLAYDLRYQKLALDEELQQLQEISTQSSPPDLTVIAPVLEKIVNDSSVLNGARARAQRLLQSAGLGK